MAQKRDYKKKMELNKLQKSEMGIVSDRFPSVSNMVIYMTYFHEAENPILMERTINIFPTSIADFNMACMIRGCDKGGFNLAPVISKLVKERKKSAKGDMTCKGKIENHSSRHAHISYRISINFRKKH
ncbi:MAG: hypothetical protein C4538_10675 [Nitrospiraceae bacterium]|nr:MAG: hypothetical protein C4538_10675 [Nitrospiraceae bacterium]